MVVIEYISMVQFNSFFQLYHLRTTSIQDYFHSPRRQSEFFFLSCSILNFVLSLGVVPFIIDFRNELELILVVSQLFFFFFYNLTFSSFHFSAYALYSDCSTLSNPYKLSSQVSHYMIKHHESYYTLLLLFSISPNCKPQSPCRHSRISTSFHFCIRQSRHSNACRGMVLYIQIMMMSFL